MREACSLIWSALVLSFRSRASLAAEILVLRHQINILRRHSPKRQTFSAMDRLEPWKSIERRDDPTHLPGRGHSMVHVNFQPCSDRSHCTFRLRHGAIGRVEGGSVTPVDLDQYRHSGIGCQMVHLVREV